MIFLLLSGISRKSLVERFIMLGIVKALWVCSLLSARRSRLLVTIWQVFMHLGRLLTWPIRAHRSWKHYPSQDSAASSMYLLFNIEKPCEESFGSRQRRKSLKLFSLQDNPISLQWARLRHFWQEFDSKQHEENAIHRSSFPFRLIIQKFCPFRSIHQKSIIQSIWLRREEKPDKLWSKNTPILRPLKDNLPSPSLRRKVRQTSWPNRRKQIILRTKKFLRQNNQNLQLWTCYLYLGQINWTPIWHFKDHKWSRTTIDETVIWISLL